MLGQISNCEMSPAPLTDHRSIDLSVTPLSQSARKKGYWKFNANLLKHEDYCNSFKDLTQEVLQDNSIHFLHSDMGVFKIQNLPILNLLQ